MPHMRHRRHIFVRLQPPFLYEFWFQCARACRDMTLIVKLMVKWNMTLIVKLLDQQFP